MRGKRRKNGKLGPGLICSLMKFPLRRAREVSCIWSLNYFHSLDNTSFTATMSQGCDRFVGKGWSECKNEPEIILTDDSNA